MYIADIAIAKEIERQNDVSVAPNQGENEGPGSSKRPKGLLKEFLFDVNPINAEEWHEGSFLIKLLLIMRAPFMFLLQLFVPVVNETAEKRGWSKLLNCFQIWMTPIAALVVLSGELFFSCVLAARYRVQSSPSKVNSESSIDERVCIIIIE